MEIEFCMPDGKANYAIWLFTYTLDKIRNRDSLCILYLVFYKGNVKLFETPSTIIYGGFQYVYIENIYITTQSNTLVVEAGTYVYIGSWLRYIFPFTLQLAYEYIAI